jgi:hypothetical protein
MKVKVFAFFGSCEVLLRFRLIECRRKMTQSKINGFFVIFVGKLIIEKKEKFHQKFI